MREPAFILSRHEAWQRIEEGLRAPRTVSAEVLAEWYVEITDDLAHARAQYPRGRSVAYLNGLSATAHGVLYGTKRIGGDHFRRFWLTDVPMALVGMRRQILLSAAIMLASVVIGLVSGMQDEQYVRSVLGDAYVDMTLQNIADGNPMGVYRDEDGFAMFGHIAMNNVWVFLRIVVAGLLTSIVPMVMLVYNGTMVGAFHALFHRHGEVSSFFLGVYIHGAMELSILIVAAAAGITFGNGLLFPGTYTRMQAMTMAMRRAITVALGMVPFTIGAALLESFVTRLVDLPVVMKVAIIVGTFVAIWWYVLVLPVQVLRRRRGHEPGAVEGAIAGSGS